MKTKLRLESQRLLREMISQDRASLEALAYTSELTTAEKTERRNILEGEIKRRLKLLPKRKPRKKPIAERKRFCYLDLLRLARYLLNGQNEQSIRAAVRSWHRGPDNKRKGIDI